MVTSELPQALSCVPLLKVQFFGTQTRWELLQNSPVVKSLLLIRPELVLAYLRILKDTNPQYANVKIKDEASAIAEIKTLENALAAGIEVIDDPGLIAIDANRFRY